MLPAFPYKVIIVLVLLVLVLIVLGAHKRASKIVCAIFFAAPREQMPPHGPVFDVLADAAEYSVCV